MKRKERSWSRSSSQLRKHIRKNQNLKENNSYDKHENLNKRNDDSSSEDNSEDKLLLIGKNIQIL